MARTILVSDNPHGEGNVLTGETINPGHLIDIDPATGDLLVHQTAAANAVPRFARERDWVGDDADDAYAAGERVDYFTARPGDRVYAKLAAAAAAVARGDFLESAGDGTLRVLTTDAATDDTQRESVVAQALEAVDNSGGGSEAWILVEVL